MKVLINAMTISPGGGLTVICGTLEALLAAGHDCEIHVGRRETADRVLKEFKGAKHFKCQYSRILFGTAGRYLWMRYVMPWLPAVRAADCYFCINNYFPGNRTTVVYHINLLHFIQNYSGKINTRGLAGWIKDKSAMKALRRATINLFESKYLYDSARGFVDPVANPRILYFKSNFADKFDEQKKCLSMPQKKMNQIVAVTSDQKHKDNPTLADMLSGLVKQNNFQDWVLVVVGGGRFSDLRARAEELSVADRIVFRGRVAQSELAHILRESLCLVTASKVESFCMVAVESMSLGCPVIVANEASMPESVGGWGAIVQAGCGEEFAEAAERYRTEPSFYEDTVEGGRHFVAKYSSDNFARELSLALSEAGIGSTGSNIRDVK